MAELIAFSLFLVGLAGMFFIVFGKTPILVKIDTEKNKKSGVVKAVFDQVITSRINNFFSELFLQKILSKTRVLALKTEHKINSWLSHLRQKSINKNYYTEDYWKNIKKEEKK